MIGWWLVAETQVKGDTRSSGVGAINAVFGCGPGYPSAQACIRTVKAAKPVLYMKLPEHVSSLGYPVETHHVHTADGYILTVHRIPRGRNQTASHRNIHSRPPLLMIHGFLGNSDQWVLMGPRIAPGLVLADGGYDVWLGNIRGTAYSRQHETMKRGDIRFWNFSFHEIGIYDIPAMIDYILNVTHEERLFYVGHSMGNMVFYVMTSLRPEYNDKVRLQMSLGPGTFFEHVSSPIVQIAKPNAELINVLVSILPSYEINLLGTEASRTLMYLLCHENSFYNKFCGVIYSFAVGAVDLNNVTNVDLYLARGFTSTSALVALHIFQLVVTGQFRQYDRGTNANIIAYGSHIPPEYPLRKVTAPVALYAADSDFLVNPKDVERLGRSLANVVSMHVVKERFFNHFDFMFHENINQLVTNHMLELMQMY